MRRLVLASVFFLAACDKSAGSASSAGATAQSTGTSSSKPAASAPTAAPTPAASAAPSSSASTAGGPPACDFTAERSNCVEFEGPDRSVEKVKETCAKDPKAVYLANGCPKQDVVGICTSEGGKAKHFSYSKGGSPQTEATAKDTCKAVGGEWAVSK